MQRQTTSQFKPLPEGQRKIGFRVAYFRKCSGISRQRLADEAGLTLNQLANVESGRVPLKAIAAWRICQPVAMDIHPQFLFGGYPQLPFPLLSSGQKKRFEREVLANAAETFWDFWSKFGWLFQSENADCSESVSKVECKPMVDNSNNSATLVAVSSEIPTWKQLVQELKRRTKAPGAKVRLANDLKTSRQNVNKWLSGKGAPSAELILELLRWVKRPVEK